MAKLSTTSIYGNLTVDGEIINDSLDFDRIPYGSASGSANAYTVTVNNFSLKDGKGIAVKIPVNSTGACTLNVNGLGAKAIKKANGTDANNLKAGSIYTVRYNGTDFILQGESESGVANSAVKLQTARNINGVAFDGTKDITTAKWGTARTVQIGNTTKTVDGSSNMSWSLSEIGAASSSHTHNYASSSHNHDSRYYTQRDIDDMLPVGTSTYTPKIVSMNGDNVPIAPGGTITGSYAVVGNICFVNITITGAYDTSYSDGYAYITLPKTAKVSSIMPISMDSGSDPVCGMTGANNNKMMITGLSNFTPPPLSHIASYNGHIYLHVTGFYFI